MFDWTKNTDPIARQKNLLTLDENWDGYGSPRFFVSQVDRSLALYSRISSFYLSKNIDIRQFPVFVAPCSDGSILFEWAGLRFPERQLEIFVPPSLGSPLEFLKSTADLNQEGTFLIDQVDALLDWLLFHLKTPRSP